MDLNTLKIHKLSDVKWKISAQGLMHADIIVYGSQRTINEFKKELHSDIKWSSLRQLVNITQLPGVQSPVIAMADVHPGYGFPIGGIGAFDVQTGVVSVAGVGFDCNCGVRTLTTILKKKDIEAQQEDLANELFRSIPAGVGSKGSVRLNTKELDKMLHDGAPYVIKKGFGTSNDAEFIEEQGCLENADPSAVSDKAKERQFKQVGTLGSGNHYLEVQYVDEIYDEDAARIFGIFPRQVTVSIHCGSRALGHQIGTDYLKILASATQKYNIRIPDKELVCAPIKSSEAQTYFRALACAVNCAFANRQVLAHLTREVFQRVYRMPYDQIKTLYDVGHNNAKVEEHMVQGEQKRLLIHRKGATRALGPGYPGLPELYRTVGQPVLVGGTMGTASYILRGTEKGMKESFGSSVHGAGRRLSRHESKKRYHARDVMDELHRNGVIIKGASFAGIAEEAPGAYKDVDEVVDIVFTFSLF